MELYYRFFVMYNVYSDKFMIFSKQEIYGWRYVNEKEENFDDIFTSFMYVEQNPDLHESLDMRYVMVVPLYENFYELVDNGRVGIAWEDAEYFYDIFPR